METCTLEITTESETCSRNNKLGELYQGRK